MRLLFDQNLAPVLARRMADLFRDSLHVRSVGLERAADDEVWRYALEHGLSIVTRDSDFQERSQIATSAPHSVWIRRGNCSTDEIESPLRKHAASISALTSDDGPGFLILL